MIEDTILSQLYVMPIDSEKVVFAADGEIAYSLNSNNLGVCKDEEDEKIKLRAASSTPNTLGFELYTEIDMDPGEIVMFTADKQPIAQFSWGEHAPGENKYPEKCRFKPGDKVLCVVYEGYDAVIPGIVIGPLTEEYLRELYTTDDDLQIGYNSADEVVEAWSDWNWDAIVVRPLVRLDNIWGGMKDTILVNRVYLFDYKKFEV